MFVQADIFQYIFYYASGISILVKIFDFVNLFTHGLIGRFIAGLGFYGLNFNVENLTGSVFVNNAISGAAELPVAFLILMSHRLGRRSVTVTSLFVGSVALIASSLITMYLDLQG